MAGPLQLMRRGRKPGVAGVAVSAAVAVAAGNVAAAVVEAAAVMAAAVVEGGMAVAAADTGANTRH